MIGRNAAAMLSTSSVARFVLSLTPNATHRLCIRAAPVAHRRLYATPGRPRKAVGESTTVKRAAPKKSAAKTASKESTAVRAGAKKAKTTVDKPSKETKAAALEQRRKERLREKQRKAKAKESAKTAAAKAKLKAKTAADKAKYNSEAAKLARLKETALTPPERGARSGWNLFASTNKELFQEELKSPEHTQELSGRWHALSSSEQAHYQRLADEKKKAYQATLQQWVHAQPVETIAAANRARKALRRLDKTKKPWSTIVDDRAAARRLSGYLMFTSEFLAGTHDNGLERLKEAAVKWRALSDAEKQTYNDRAIQRKAQYDSGYDTSSSSPQQASASA